MAFAIGVHPAIALGSLAIGSIDEDERAIMGGLFGEPLELVKCETSDVLVPAHAEMVIEGEILPGERTPEGPFGEFTGYSLGERQREVLQVRPSPTARAPCSRTSRWPTSTTCCSAPSRWRRTSTARCAPWCPRSKAVRVPGPFTCYVSIEQRLIGQAKNAILAVLGADLYMKRVVVVDHDVDIFDDRQMTWAIATRCQPDRDITVITNARGSDLDPSTREDGYSGKWGVDATAKPSLAAYTPRHRVPPDVDKRLDLKAFDLLTSGPRPPRSGRAAPVAGVMGENFAALLEAHRAATRRMPPRSSGTAARSRCGELERRAGGCRARARRARSQRPATYRAGASQSAGPSSSALSAAPEAGRDGGAAQPAPVARRSASG